MERFNERLGFVITDLGYNKSSFSKEIGLDNNVVIGRLVKEIGRRPSFEVTARIIKRFPEINPRWLILGDGEMYDKDPDDLPDFSDRVGKILKYLRITPQELANICSLTVAEMGAILTRGGKVSKKNLHKVSESVNNQYPEINRNWIENNIAPMFLSEDAMIHKLITGAVPCVNDPDHIPEIKSVQDSFMLIEGFSGGFCIQMFGENMTPILNPSDRIICRKIEPGEIIYGEIHLVILNAGTRRINYTRKGTEPDTLELISANPEYDSVIIKISDIKSVFRVEGMIRKFSL